MTAIVVQLLPANANNINAGIVRSRAITKACSRRTHKRIWRHRHRNRHWHRQHLRRLASLRLEYRYHRCSNKCMHSIMSASTIRRRRRTTATTTRRRIHIYAMCQSVVNISTPELSSICTRFRHIHPRIKRTRMEKRRKQLQIQILLLQEPETVAKEKRRRMRNQIRDGNAKKSDVLFPKAKVIMQTMRTINRRRVKMAVGKHQCLQIALQAMRECMMMML
mmetsp:Transcript_23662/g.37896  ORF Transcript_23662/g.37896 Transcript_23662/m.37896 type:complete len:221 (+) Transcript_23662:174-836(+)